MTDSDARVEGAERSTAGGVAVLGLGAMGRRMASRLCTQGHKVRVWSRSGIPPDDVTLASCGAASAAAAVEGADVVIVMVTDDAASRAVWLGGGVLDAMARHAVAVDASTTSVGWTTELAREAARRGVGFVAAPVLGSRPQAEAGTLVVLAGGEVGCVDRVRATLGALAGVVHHVGSAPAAVTVKLVANALFAAQVAAVGELLALGRGGGFDAPTAVRALAASPVLSPAAAGAASGILAEGFSPMFPLGLAIKDLRYALDAGQGVGTTLPLTAATLAVFERAAARGWGEENLTAVAKLYPRG